MSCELKIDDVNVKILKTLIQEPRTTYAKIALDCGLSTPNIYNRFKLLEKTGIINEAIMQIDPKSVGYDCVALLIIESNAKDKEAVQNFLQSQNISIYTPHLSGSGILSFIAAKTMDELAKKIKK